MDKKSLFSIGMMVVGIAFFIIIINYIGWDEIVAQFSNIEPSHILMYLAISICIVIVLVIKWKVILRSMGYDVSFFKLFMYRQMGFAVGYIVPAFYIGGESVKAYLLKDEGVPISDAASSVLIDRAVELPMNFLLACIMFFMVMDTIPLPSWMLITLGAIIIVMFGLCVMFYYKVYRKEYFFTFFYDLLGLDRWKKLHGFKRQMMATEASLIRFFNKKIKFVVFCIGVSFLLWVLMMIEYWMGLRIVGFEATAAQIYLVVVMIGFSMTLPVPASIGVMELGQIGICMMVGIPAAVAVALSLLVRTRDLMWILLGIGFYIYSGASYLGMMKSDVHTKGHELVKHHQSYVDNDSVSAKVVKPKAGPPQSGIGKTSDSAIMFKKRNKVR